MLAVDIDARFLAGIDAPNLVIREQDVVDIELPEHSLDLVHIRLVLLHLTEERRAEALRRMVAALKPGGWLLAEEMDFISVAADPTYDADAAATFQRLAVAHVEALRPRNFDSAYGRRLFSDLVTQGLVDLGCEGQTYMCNGGSPGATAWRLTFEQLRGPMEAGGAVTEAEIATGIRLLTNPAFRLMSQVFMTAWGRKPA